MAPSQGGFHTPTGTRLISLMICTLLVAERSDGVKFAHTTPGGDPEDRQLPRIFTASELVSQRPPCHVSFEDPTFSRGPRCHPVCHYPLMGRLSGATTCRGSLRRGWSFGHERKKSPSPANRNPEYAHTSLFHLRSRSEPHESGRNPYIWATWRGRFWRVFRTSPASLNPADRPYASIPGNAFEGSDP
jgi:hypothetical protein